VPLSSAGFPSAVEPLYTRIKIYFCKIIETVLNDCIRFKEDFPSIKVAKKYFIKNFNNVLVWHLGKPLKSSTEIYSILTTNMNRNSIHT